MVHKLRLREYDMNNCNDLLYMIADNLGTKLQVVGDSIRGVGVKNVTIAGITYRFMMTVKDSHVSKDKSEGVILAHVSGDLYLLLHCSLGTNISTVLLLDNTFIHLHNMTKMLPLHCNLKIITNSHYYSRGIIGIFNKKGDNKWVEVQHVESIHVS